MGELGSGESPLGFQLAPHECRIDWVMKATLGRVLWLVVPLGKFIIQERHGSRQPEQGAERPHL